MKLKITVDNKTYEVDVEAEETEQPAHNPVYSPAAVHFTPPPMPVAAPPAGATGDGVADESKVCRSPIVGVVVRVNAQEGQQVKTDDSLLVLEAMKMETTITSPVSGKVKKFRIGVGESVQSGQVLVDFE